MPTVPVQGAAFVRWFGSLGEGIVEVVALVGGSLAMPRTKSELCGGEGMGGVARERLTPTMA